MRKQIPVLLALLSGAIFGLAFVNGEFSWISLFCLVPLFLGISQAPDLRTATLCGMLAGFTAVIIATWPLSSGNSWTGWQFTAAGQISNVDMQRAHFLKLICVLCAVLGGSVFWGLFALLVKYLNRNLNPWLVLLLLPALWVIIVDWLMVFASLGYQWMPIGAMLSAFPWLEQSAAVGGVLLLSTISVLINSVVYILINYRKRPGIWLIPLTTTILVGIIGVAGLIRMNNLKKEPAKYGVAIIQFIKPGDYTPSDYTSFFMDKHYLRFSRQAYQRFPERFELMVLPETVGFGSIALNQSMATEKVTSTIDQWTQTLKTMIKDQSIYILGMDTMDSGKKYNSMLVWSACGLAGIYHKRRLVPFAEYQPDLGNLLENKSNFTYHAGRGAQIITLGKWKLGFFICQEVLFPELLRESVQAGANILISSGNDGVFSNPTVARINANAARLRALETGRYIVRAMRSGISAIISPDGQLVTYAEIGVDKVLVNLVSVNDQVTYYVRWGNWLIGLLSFVLGGIVAIRINHHRRDRNNLREVVNTTSY